jgi:hypothetical protein
VFFYEQLTLGFWVAVRRLHGGLPYLAARVVAALGSVAPSAAIPLVYTTSSIAVTSLAAATFSLPSFRHLVRRDVIRVAVCIAAICLPAGQDLLTVACSLGYFVALWLVLLSVMSTPRTRIGTGAWCIGGALGVLSAHAAPIGAPLWLHRAARGIGRREPRDVCFAATQLVVLLLVIGVARTDWNATMVAGNVPFFTHEPAEPSIHENAVHVSAADDEQRAPWTVRVDFGQQLLEVAALETRRGLVRWR